MASSDKGLYVLILLVNKQISGPFCERGQESCSVDQRVASVAARVARVSSAVRARRLAKCNLYNY